MNRDCMRYNKLNNKNKQMNNLMKCIKGSPLFLLLFFVVACSSSEDDDDIIGDWTRKSDFAGVARSGAVVFTIGERVFIGTGYDGTDYLKDFYEYDANRNSWFKRADFPGAARNSAVSFTANGKGYVGTGTNGVVRYKDFYEYDPSADTWKQVADFSGSARYGCVALSLNNMGYIGSGYDGNDQSDWWEYNPSANTWAQKANNPRKRSNAFSLVIGEQGYVGGGINNNVYVTDFSLYDPATDAWIKKYALTDENDDDDYDYDYSLQRTYASTFVINGLGYIATGNYSSALTNVWEYNPTADEWTQKTSLEASAREAAVGFAVGNKGYVTTGRSGATRFDDLWELDPSAEQVDNN